MKRKWLTSIFFSVKSVSKIGNEVSFTFKNGYQEKEVEKKLYDWNPIFSILNGKTLEDICKVEGKNLSWDNGKYQAKILIVNLFIFSGLKNFVRNI
ncbi:hypothetical protein OVS_03560 [Mycoplasma ovis str. Michigan]|uniref:DUF2442 domain-containing protein n=1 Tax=Mycoplasma ovis str. Michigan TaxID=1415773 RepID=A0ABM5P1V0_9MOLU|nr:hypothetical protein [Mycoplasma ovis]AHC40461.1 hypothetical protein OVS_03560 [Mycoplasma ovis str. Michigan]